MKKEQIRQYYRKTDKIKLPDNPTWRHFRIRKHNGRVIGIRAQINHVEKLRKILIKAAATDVWHSKAIWLHPEDIGPKDISNKPLYQIQDQILMTENKKTELVFDFDASFSIEGLEQARKDTLEMIKHQKQKGLTPKTIKFTGKKGFQVIFEDELKLPKDPRERIESLEKHRKTLIKRLPKLKTLDQAITEDAMRVIRTTGTIRKNNLIATELTQEQLKQPTEELIQEVNYYEDMPVIPQEHVVDDDLPRARTQAEPGRAGISPLGNIRLNLTNGLGKRRTIIMEFKRTNPERVKKKLQSVRDTYETGPLAIAKFGKNTYVFGAKTFDPRRLEKIMKAARAHNTQTLNKFSYNYLPLKDLQKQIKPAGKVEGEVKGWNWSKPHYKFINNFIEHEKPEKFHNQEELTTTYTVK